MKPPLGELAFLYMGTSDFDRDVSFYRDVLGAERVWAFRGFGARVAGFRVCEIGPLVLLADHRPAPSCLPVYRVDDLDAAAAALKTRGWQPDGEPFEIPNGPCLRFTDASGNQLALFQNDRPDELAKAWADQSNPKAIRD